jgi:hypothetical protein
MLMGKFLLFSSLSHCLFVLCPEKLITSLVLLIQLRQCDRRAGVPRISSSAHGTRCLFLFLIDLKEEKVCTKNVYKIILFLFRL